MANRIRIIKRWNGAEWVEYELGLKKIDILGHISEGDNGFVTGDEIYVYVENVKADFDEKINQVFGGEELDDTLDSIKEIQEWIGAHGENATNLASALQQETKDRAAADDALREGIEQGIVDLTAADAMLRADLNAEIIRATKKENEMFTALNQLADDISWHDM